MINKNDFEMLAQALGGYFYQSFHQEYANKEEALLDICKGYSEEYLLKILDDIVNLINITENEDNLKNFLCKEFQLSVTPETDGINLDTYTEFLEYIRDKISHYLKLKGAKKEDFEMLSHIFACYFNQDFHRMYKDKDDAIENIIMETSEQHQMLLIKEINDVLKFTEIEENLEKFLDSAFSIELGSQTDGINLDTYWEFLEYIRDKFFNHLIEQGMKPEQISKDYSLKKTITEKINIYFKEKDIKLVREELLTTLNSKDYEKARTQIIYLNIYYRDYKYNLYKNITSEKRKELEYVIKDILDENGLIKEFVNLYPKVKNYKFLTSDTEHFQTLDRLEVIVELNFFLFTLKNTSLPDDIEKIKLAIDNILKADFYFSLENTEQNRLKALQAQVFFRRSSIIHSFVTNHNLESSQNHYKQRMTVFNIIFDCSDYLSCCMSYFTNDISYSLAKIGSNECLSKASFLLQQTLDAANRKDYVKFEESLDKAWEYHFELSLLK
jgi:CdiI immunity protein